ncbi:MAG TPA: hypothetical protein VNA28_07540 [Solirubrobacteraceae bacterium]|nr:hypothetical protein [Solirubrobacteraceae bacterium]
MLTLPERLSTRTRLLTVAGLGGAVCAVIASVAFAAASPTVVISDPDADVAGPLDLTRASLQRASDGRLRAVVTFREKVTPKTLLASSGPPGSACVRIWTPVDSDPTAMAPDRLVCITARSADELRGGVFDTTDAGLPKRIADASVKRNSSGRSVVIRFTQSSLGRPERARFAVESTRPGCERVSCIDTAPDAGATRTFRLR